MFIEQRRQKVRMADDCQDARRLGPPIEPLERRCNPRPEHLAGRVVDRSLHASLRGAREWGTVMTSGGAISLSVASFRPQPESCVARGEPPCRKALEGGC